MMRLLLLVPVVFHAPTAWLVKQPAIPSTVPAIQELQPAIYFPMVIGLPEDFSPPGTVVIDHETEDLNQYTVYQTGQNTVSVTAEAALAGSDYGMVVNLTGSSDTTYGAKRFFPSWATGIFRTRFYIDPNGIRRTPGLGGNIFLFSTAAGQFLGGVSFGMNETGTSHVIYATIEHDANRHRETSSRSISNGPHYIEVEWRRATGPRSANGSVSLWVDGRLVDTQDGIDNYHIWTDIGGFALGATANIPNVSVGTYYLDELVCNPTGELIGPVQD